MMSCIYLGCKIQARLVILLLTMVYRQNSLRDDTKRYHIFIFRMVRYLSHWMMYHPLYIFQSAEIY